MGRKARQWLQLANIWRVCLLGVLTAQQPTRLELVSNPRTAGALKGPDQVEGEAEEAAAWSSAPAAKKM
jgi:hypothetical protein